MGQSEQQSYLPLLQLPSEDRVKGETVATGWQVTGSDIARAKATGGSETTSKRQI